MAQTMRSNFMSPAVSFAQESGVLACQRGQAEERGAGAVLLEYFEHLVEILLHPRTVHGDLGFGGGSGPPGLVVVPICHVDSESVADRFHREIL